VQKGTLSKAIATGKLSATRRLDKSFSIAAAELARYANENGHRFGRRETENEARPDPALAGRLAVLEAQLAAERELRAAERRRGDDLERQRDQWMEQAQQALRLALPAPSTTVSADHASANTAAPRRRWGWLLGPRVGEILPA
jgi:hypothetical protein